MGYLTKPNIKNGFHSSVDFVDFSGHGSAKWWATHPPDEYSNWIPSKTIISPWTGFTNLDYYTYNFNNKAKLPVVVFSACSCSNFMKAADTISWVTVSRANGGGIACFGLSGVGYGVPGADMTGRLVGWMEVNIFDKMYSTKELGESWGSCITNYYNTFAGNLDLMDYKTMLEFTMFGDPTLVIEDGDDPVANILAFPQDQSSQSTPQSSPSSSETQEQSLPLTSPSIFPTNR